MVLVFPHSIKHKNTQLATFSSKIKKINPQANEEVAAAKAEAQAAKLEAEEAKAKLSEAEKFKADADKEKVDLVPMWTMRYL
jgi:hypothetical protein